MKTIRNTFLFFIFLLTSNSTFSQNTSQVFQNKMGETLEELTPDQRKALMIKAATLVEEENVNKAIMQVAKQLSKTDQEKLFQHALMEIILSSDEPIEVASYSVEPKTLVMFKEPTFDFGVIKEGEKVVHNYKFVNTGSKPLMIKEVKGSCGCTIPIWSKEAIAPGESSEIQIEFYSKGKSGLQNKRITITANTNPVQTFIYIKGQVLKDE